MSAIGWNDTQWEVVINAVLDSLPAYRRETQKPCAPRKLCYLCKLVELPFGRRYRYCKPCAAIANSWRRGKPRTATKGKAQ